MHFVVHNPVYFQFILVNYQVFYIFFLFPDELAHQLNDSEAKIIITQISLVSVLKQALFKMKKQIPTIVLKQHVRYSIIPNILFPSHLVSGI